MACDVPSAPRSRWPRRHRNEVLDLKTPISRGLPRCKLHPHIWCLFKQPASTHSDAGTSAEAWFALMSSVEVSVAWETPAVFAGQDLKCRITFRNISTSPSQKYAKIRSTDQAGSPGKPPVLRQLAPGDVRLRAPGSKRQAWAHRATSSFHATDRFENAEAAFAKPQKHKRSVSILSISSSPTVPREHAVPRPNREASKPTVGPRAESSSNFSLSKSSPHSFVISPGELTATELETQTPVTSSRFRKTAGSDTNLHRSSRPTRSRSPAVLAGFEQNDSSWTQHLDTGSTRPNDKVIPSEAAEPARIRQDGKGITDQNANIRAPFRIASYGNPVGTPRSSIDDYSLSNHSSDTLASEYPAAFLNPRPSRRAEDDSTPSPFLASNGIRKPETLMMGYVQLVGGFILDGSLVSPSPFERAKRRGVIGGQAGGGVVGVDHSTKNNGLLGSFGWAKFGRSFGSMLNGKSDLSSFREMKGIADDKAIPIISTPQAVLFVNMTLRPGESKSFSYSHALPSAIPPTYKGRTIRSTYHLLIGTQKQQSATEKPRVTHVEAPFRVLPALDGLSP